MNIDFDIRERPPACDERLQVYDNLLTDERALVKEVLSYAFREIALIINRVPMPTSGPP
jgi:hypothetical protein